MTLTDFLLARIADREAMAEQAKVADRYLTWDLSDDGVCDEQGGHVGLSPERVLAECEAQRRIVELSIDNNEFSDPYETEKVWEVVLPLMALPYADHPDYRAEWKP